MGTSVFSQNLKNGISVQLTMSSTLLSVCWSLICVGGMLQLFKENTIGKIKYNLSKTTVF